MIPHLGVLSRHTGDWTNPQKAIDAGIKSVTIKLTDGDGTDDAKGLPNARIAESSGVPWSAGTYPEPNGTAPSAQAMKLIERSLMAGDPELPYSLNVEGVRVGTVPPPERYGAFLRMMVDTIIDEDGRPPILVVQQNWWDDKVAPSGIAFDDCYLRVMEWPKKPQLPPVITGYSLDTQLGDVWNSWLQGLQPDPVIGWDTWHAWQFSCDAVGADYGFTGGTTSKICVNIVKDDVHAAWLPPSSPDLQGQIDALHDWMSAMDDRIETFRLDFDHRLQALGALITDNERRKTGEINQLQEIQSNHATRLTDLVSNDQLLHDELAPFVAILKAIRG